MISFYKYTGAGNDFILFEGDVPSSIPQLCDRKRGIGADGVLLLQKIENSRYKMQIFNSDGSEAEMCGNGLRACFLHLLTHYPNHAPFTIESMFKTHKGWRCPDGEIEVEMGSAHLISQKQSFNGVVCDLINSGVPHLIIKETLSVPFAEVAPPLRRLKNANVNVVEPMDGGWKVSTYERGVEGVTDACGTGVVASALSLALEEKIHSPVTLQTPGGYGLTVSWSGRPEAPELITLKGKTALVFEGYLVY